MAGVAAPRTRVDVLKETWGAAIHKLISGVCKRLNLPKPKIVCDAEEQCYDYDLDCWWSFEFSKAVVSVVVWVSPLTDAKTVCPEILIAEFSVRPPSEFMCEKNTVGRAIGFGTFPRNKKRIIAELKRPQFQN